MAGLGDLLGMMRDLGSLKKRVEEAQEELGRQMAEASAGHTPPVNITEYLEHLDTLGVAEDDFTPIQPIFQKRIWDRFKDGSGPEAMAQAIEALRREDRRFHMEGGSWTGHLSWVRGYEHVLGPMEEASRLFAERVLAKGVSSAEPRYRRALVHLLAGQTSCFRYWGKGAWTDYGRELCRRTMDILHREF